MAIWQLELYIIFTMAEKYRPQIDEEKKEVEKKKLLIPVGGVGEFFLERFAKWAIPPEAREVVKQASPDSVVVYVKPYGNSRSNKGDASVRPAAGRPTKLWESEHTMRRANDEPMGHLTESLWMLNPGDVLLVHSSGKSKYVECYEIARPKPSRELVAYRVPSFFDRKTGNKPTDFDAQFCEGEEERQLAATRALEAESAAMRAEILPKLQTLNERYKALDGFSAMELGEVSFRDFWGSTSYYNAEAVEKAEWLVAHKEEEVASEKKRLEESIRNSTETPDISAEQAHPSSTDSGPTTEQNVQEPEVAPGDWHRDYKKIWHTIEELLPLLLRNLRGNEQSQNYARKYISDDIINPIQFFLSIDRDWSGSYSNFRFTTNEDLAVVAALRQRLAEELGIAQARHLQNKEKEAWPISEDGGIKEAFKQADDELRRQTPVPNFDRYFIQTTPQTEKTKPVSLASDSSYAQDDTRPTDTRVGEGAFAAALAKSQIQKTKESAPATSAKQLKQPKEDRREQNISKAEAAKIIADGQNMMVLVESVARGVSVTALRAALAKPDGEAMARAVERLKSKKNELLKDIDNFTEELISITVATGQQKDYVSGKISGLMGRAEKLANSKDAVLLMANDSNKTWQNTLSSLWEAVPQTVATETEGVVDASKRDALIIAVRKKLTENIDQIQKGQEIKLKQIIDDAAESFMELL